MTNIPHTIICEECARPFANGHREAMRHERRAIREKHGRIVCPECVAIAAGNMEGYNSDDGKFVRVYLSELESRTYGFALREGEPVLTWWARRTAAFPGQIPHIRHWGSDYWQEGQYLSPPVVPPAILARARTLLGCEVVA